MKLNETDYRSPSLTDFYTREKRMSKDNCVKYHIITTVLDYLVTSKHLFGKGKILYKDVIAWLNKRSTFYYDCGASCARTQIWIHEMTWLDLTSFHKGTQMISLTENGYKKFQDQQYHFAYASLLETKWSRKTCMISASIAIIALIASLISIII